MLLRAAAAVVALSAAVGADAVVGQALARRGAERAERDAYVCAEAAREDAVARAARSVLDRRRDLLDPGRPAGCDPNAR
ncbi:hypothetical protein GCM10010505_65980 [Kitasatospora aburaviensis]